MNFASRNNVIEHHYHLDVRSVKEMDAQKPTIAAQTVRVLELKFEKVMMTLIESEKFLEKLTKSLGSLQVGMASTMLDLLRKLDELNGHSDGSSTPSPATKSKHTSNQKVIQFPQTDKVDETPLDKKT